MRASYSSWTRRSSSGVSPPIGLLPGRLHQPLEDAVEVELAQGAVEVVGAADRPARLHAGVAGDGLAGQRPHHRLVAVHERPVEHLGQLLGGEALHAAAPLAVRSAAEHLGQELGARHPRRLPRPGEAVLRGPQREVHLEDRLEGLPVGVVLHQGGGQGVLEGLAVLEGDVRTASMASRFSVRLHGQPGRPAAPARSRPAAPASNPQPDEAPARPTRLGSAPSPDVRRRVAPVVAVAGHRPVRPTAPWPPWRCRTGT